MDHKFWRGKRVLVTGHTGFKGAWLTMWLHSMGAKVYGYALKPPTVPSLFDDCRLDKLCSSTIGDIRDLRKLSACVKKARPEVIFHMAAQPLVLESYKSPVYTYEVNVIGTANLLEAVRGVGGVKAVVCITTDKCYENNEWHWGYRENDRLGGFDPYSNSKACSELVVSAYRNSFFNPAEFKKHGVALASVRAGNVIGGGDWADCRLIPDCVRALLKGKAIEVRNPSSIRPWQHVLEPLSGYILLAEHMVRHGAAYGQAWNFGPNEGDAQPVENLVRKMCFLWGGGASYKVTGVKGPHEAKYLKLDISKARAELSWHPRWNVGQALEQVVRWALDYRMDSNTLHICLKQIKEYENADKN